MNIGSEQKLLPLTLNETNKSFMTWRKRKIYLLVYCFLGLQISYLSWGLLQEKIMTTEYQIENHFFGSYKQITNLVTISSLKNQFNGNYLLMFIHQFISRFIFFDYLIFMKISELNLNISHKTKFIYLLEVSGSK